MPKTDEDFEILMQQVMAGSDEAARDLFRDYGPFLIHAIRKKLHKKLRSRFDSCDIAQDVWASFFAEHPRKRVFDSPQALVGFLAKLARNKVLDATRRQLATVKRHAHSEQSIEDSKHFIKDRLFANQLTPSQVLISQEEWSAFLCKQPPVYRRIYVMLRLGNSTREIADELQLNLRLVQRVAERMPGTTS
jgi:RNA polymerase sigma factor (sigma-70 family)